MSLVCWKCGASLKDVPRPLARLSRCLECQSDLYCCRMCRKYEPTYIGKCSDERADPPQNKQGANFCDWFSPDPRAYSGKERSAEEASRQRLSALFGAADDSNGGPESAEADQKTATERALEEARKLFGGD